MAFAFLDTSALVKLYLPELGSTWLQNFVIGKEIIISELALFEVTVVMRRRYIEGDFARDEGIDLVAQVIRASSNYRIVPLGGEPQLTRLANLLFNLPANLRIRTLDAIHLVAASIALDAANNLTPSEPLTFISADTQLLRVIQAHGFITENPENYP